MKITQVDLSEEECKQDSDVCVTPFGTLQTENDLESIECANIGVCSGMCPSSGDCSPFDAYTPSICYLPSALNSDECWVADGDWIEGICILSKYSSQSACERHSGVYYSCEETSLENECSTPFPQSVFSCVSASWVHCERGDCTEDVGWCDNHNYFINYDVFPVRYGGCVLPYFQGTNGLFCPTSTYSIGFGYTSLIQIHTLNLIFHSLRCVHPSIPNEYECNEAGGEFHLPSFTQSLCEEKNACYLTNQNGIIKFINETECNACQGILIIFSSFE
jgi:hypothetical protein